MHKYLKHHNGDNVAIVIASDGLEKDFLLDKEGVILREHIPQAHKISLEKIPAGGNVIRYGEVIGIAIETISAGSWIKESMIAIPPAPELRGLSFNPRKIEKAAPLEGYTFMGYLNPDGSVGTRNILGIATSVQCVSGVVDYLVKKIKAELLPDFSNVDDVVAVNHSYGCGVAIQAPGAMVPIRTLKNLSTNPNFGGEVLVIGLGCEKFLPSWLIPAKKNGTSLSSIMTLQNEEFLGFEKMIEKSMELAKTHLLRLNKRKRTVCPISELIVGVQCGGSDAFSGISANPVVGYAADCIVRAGGTVLFSEVTEVRDAVEALCARAENKDVFSSIIREMDWYDSYLKTGGADRTANTTPGNKVGGLSNIVEKAMGSVVKSGSSTISDVLAPGEKIRGKGLVFAVTPASDFICGTLQLASGMNIHVFTTGRGTPYNLEMVPVIKLSSRSDLAKRWFDLIDLDAGSVAEGTATIGELGWALFKLILETAGGKQTCGEKLGISNDLVLFNPGPVT